MCGTCHTCIYYLYNMTFWGSKSVVLTMSKSYYKSRFYLESLVDKTCVIILKLLYYQVPGYATLILYGPDYDHL